MEFTTVVLYELCSEFRFDGTRWSLRLYWADMEVF